MQLFGRAWKKYIEVPLSGGEEKLTKSGNFSD